jgi:hypothetical protein
MPLFSEPHKEEPALLNWVTDQYIAGVTNLNQPRKDSKKWYDYARGDMISPTEEAELLEKGLPVLKMNIVLPKLVRIMGAEISTRSAVKAVPLLQGTNDIAHVLTQIFEWIRINSNGHNEIAKAWMDSIIADIPGWVEIVWTNDNDPLGQPIFRRINPFFVVYDVKSERYAYHKHAKWVMKTWFTTAEDIMRDHPKKKREIKDRLETASNFGVGRSGRMNIKTMVSDSWERLRGYQESLDSEFVNKKDHYYRIIEAQIREELTEIRLFDPQTHSVERVENEEELEVMQKRFPRLLAVDFKWDKIRTVTTVAGNVMMLQDIESDIQNGQFSLIPFWGYTMGGKPFGMVRNLDGPQKLYWKETSSALHVVNQTANPIWVYPRNSLSETQKNDLKKWGAKGGFHLEYDVVPGGTPPHREIITATPIAHFNLADRAQQIGNEVTGIGPNAVGQKDSANESGTLVKTRIGETLVMLEHFFDNKLLSTVFIHEYLIALIQTKMSATRMLRYVDDHGMPQQIAINLRTANKLINDIKQGEYGVAIKKGEAKFYREQKFIKLMVLANRMGANPTVLKLIVNSFDELDNFEKEELIKSIMTDSVEPRMQQLESEIRADSAQTRAEAQKEQESLTKELAAFSQAVEGQRQKAPARAKVAA